MISKIFTMIGDSLRQGVGVYWELLKLSLPLLIIIKLLDLNFSLIEKSGEWLAPLMTLVGLPGECGLVLAIGLFLHLYAAVLMLASLMSSLDLTTAQVTIIMGMCLIAHSLPVESRIAHKVGMHWLVNCSWRLMSAFIFALALDALYADTWLQAPPNVTLLPTPPTDGHGFYPWLINESRNWLLIFVVVQILVLFVNTLKAAKIDRVFMYVLAPVFKIMGIDYKTTVITMIGLLLGLSYGGGLLIAEQKNTPINRRHLLCAIAFLSLCHAIIEDTLIVMLIGAHFSGVLIGRIIFSLLTMWLFACLINRANDSFINWLTPIRDLSPRV